MVSRPQFSVITAVLDGERTIAQTITSVAGQSGATWEHLIVDNGSTDRTAAVVGAAGDERVHYHRIEPKNRSLARNVGIDMARGEYLLFLDADDWLLEGALACHRRTLDGDSACGISITDGWFCGDGGERLVRFSERRPAGHVEEPFESLVRSSGAIGAPACVAVRAEAVRRAGVRFPEDLFLGEDWLFFVLLSATTGTRYSDAETCMYRWHAANTTLGSGAAERQAQLGEVRRRIATAPWFGSLPAGTRRGFFYEYLFTDLASDFDRRNEVFGSRGFSDLPRRDQATLLRLVAANTLGGDGDAADARRRLLSSLRRMPFDWKTWALVAVSLLPPIAEPLLRRRVASRPPYADLPAVVRET
jgi:glycosyltransferase involved in cell wall biosynthesis